MRDQVSISYRAGDAERHALALRDAVDRAYGADSAYLFAAVNLL